MSVRFRALALTAFGLLTLTVACSAESGEEETDDSEGALSVSECNQRAGTAKQRHLTACPTRFDEKKAGETYTACVNAVNKPFDDATKKCADLTASAGVVTTQINTQCTNDAAARSCADLFDEFLAESAESGANAALRSTDPSIKAAAERQCKSYRDRSVALCKAAALSGGSSAVQAAKEACDDAKVNIFESIGKWWDMRQCESAKKEVTRNLQACKTTRADEVFETAFSECRKVCPGRAGSTCTPPAYAEKGYACGIIKEAGGWVRDKTCECVAQDACKQYDDEKRLDGTRCRVADGQACAASDRSAECNGTVEVTLGTQSGKPVVTKLCVRAQ
jgi:hypothetical protein